MDTKDWKGGPWTQVNGSAAGPWTWDAATKRGKFPTFVLPPGVEAHAHLGFEHGFDRAYPNVTVRFVDKGEWEVVEADA